MLDKKAVVSTVEQYADAITKELSPAAIVLYGSHAKGNAHEDSDIDVAVIFDGFKGDWLEISSRLWRLRRNISFDIEPILLDSTTDKSGFVQNIFKTGQIIYHAPNAKTSG
jgi:predicted nucleotidyltransferase